MTIWKKAISVGTSAALLASLLITAVAPAAFASTAVGSAGNIAIGGTSAGTATFTFTENTATSFPSGGGTITVTIKDSVGASTVTFSGTPVVSGPDSLGATASASGNTLTITLAGASNFITESVSVTGLKIKASSAAALGAIKATTGGTIPASAYASGTTTATGTLQSLIGTNVTVNTTSVCSFAVSGNTATFGSQSGVVITSVSGGAPGVQNIGLSAALSGSHVIGEAVSQTVTNCAITVLASPGTVVNSVTQNAFSELVLAGENNQGAGETQLVESRAGAIQPGSLTFTLSPAGVQFSHNPTVSATTTPLTTPTSLGASVYNGGNLDPGTYWYVVQALNAAGHTDSSVPVSATLTTGGSIEIDWATVAGATSYNVYGRPATSGGTYGLLGNVLFNIFWDDGTVVPGAAPPAGNTATITTPTGVVVTGNATGGTLAAGTYGYRVSATTAAGETLASATTSGIVTSSTGSVSISWTAVPGATGYKVYGRTGGGELFMATVTGTSFTDTGAITPAGALPVANTATLPAPAGMWTWTWQPGSLTAGTYSYRVSATNAVGETLASADALGTPVLNHSAIWVTWASVSGATGYKLYRGNNLLATTTGTDWWDDGSVTPDATLHPALTNTTGGVPTSFVSDICQINFDRTACTVTVDDVSTVPATITLFDIDLDVASTVPAGAAIDATASISPAVTITVNSATVAYVQRLIAGVAAQPTIYINYNDQSSGMITLAETGAGFFQSGVSSNNTFGVCINTGETFTRAPWAVVEPGGDLKLAVGSPVTPATQAQGTLFTDPAGRSCAYWTVYSASTVKSTIDIRGADASNVPLATGANNGPRLNVGPTLTPGTTQMRILNGTHDDVLGGGAFMSLVSNAVRAYKSGVVVTALSQPLIPAGTGDALAGNLKIAETLNGQFKPGEIICVEILPRTTNNVRTQDTILKTATTNDLPVVSTNAASGLLADTIVTPGCPIQQLTDGWVTPTLTNSFSFHVTQQAFGGTLGEITISNIHYITTADAPAGPVLVGVAGAPLVTSAVVFQSVVSNARIGAKAKLNIGAVSALGLNPTSGYTTKTPKTQAVGKYITWKFTGGTALAGQRVNVLMATKVNGAWTGPKYYVSRWADANGIVTFTWKSATAKAINVRVQWPGNANYAVSVSKALGAYWK